MEPRMNARQAFEKMMQTKNIEVFWDGKKYNTANIQTKWRYFLMGWNMKEING